MALNENKIEQQLLENLDQYIANEFVRVKSISEKDNPAIDNSKKIEALKKEMKRLTIAYRKGRVEEDEYDEDYTALEKELKQLESADKPEERDLTALKQVLESDYRTIYEALDKPHKKAFWRNIIKEFVVDENRQIVPERIIFF